MCNIAHAFYRSRKYRDRHRTVVYADILRKLVVSSLYKCAVNAIKRLTAVCRNAGSQCNGVLLCDSNVHKLLARLFADVLSETENGRGRRSYRANALVCRHFLQQVIFGQAVKALAAEIENALAGFGVKRHTPVPVLLVLFCGLVTLALLSHDVYRHRALAVLYTLECVDKLFEVVAFFHENVVKPH